MAALLLRRGASRVIFRSSTRFLSTVPPSQPSSTPQSQAKATQDPENSSRTPLTVSSLDFDPGERTGARSAKDSLSSIERKRQKASRGALVFSILALASAYTYLGREWEENEKRPQGADVTGNSPSAWIARSNARVGNLLGIFTDPVAERLLPPLPPDIQVPTLVLSIDDLLVTSTWDRQHGWRTAKRPGVDYFLGYLSQFYEIVIFSSQSSYTGIPILEKLDPYTAYISHRLFREATSTKPGSGSVVKDLNYLNRDLSKVVAIDTNPEVYSENPDNAIIIPKWKGDSHDTGLVGLIPFLESMAFLQLPDVRAAIKPMAGKNVALEFAKNEAESKRQHIEAWHSSRKPVSTKSLGQMFGLTTPSSNDASQPPPTFLEQRRKEAQQKFQEFRDYLIKYGPQIRQQQEEERERQMKEMSGSMWGMLAGAPGKPEDSSTGEKSNSAK